MRARYDYDPREGGATLVPEAEQMPFRKGDVLYVNYGQAGREDGFVMAHGEDGDMGFVPIDFLEDVSHVPASISRTNSAMFSEPSLA